MGFIIEDNGKMIFILFVDVFNEILLNIYSVNIINYEMDENCYFSNRNY